MPAQIVARSRFPSTPDLRPAVPLPKTSSGRILRDAHARSACAKSKAPRKPLRYCWIPAYSSSPRGNRAQGGGPGRFWPGPEAGGGVQRMIGSRPHSAKGRSRLPSCALGGMRGEKGVLTRALTVCLVVRLPTVPGSRESPPPTPTRHPRLKRRPVPCVRTGQIGTAAG